MRRECRDVCTHTHARTHRSVTFANSGSYLVAVICCEVQDFSSGLWTHLKVKPFPDERRYRNIHTAIRCNFEVFLTLVLGRETMKREMSLTFSCQQVNRALPNAH